MILRILVALLAKWTLLCRAAAVDVGQRVDCLPSPYPEDKKAECAKVGCVWDEQFDKYKPTVPLCYFPPDSGYAVLSTDGDAIQLRWPASSALKNPYSNPNLDVELVHQQMGASGEGVYVKIGRNDRRIRVRRPVHPNRHFPPLRPRLRNGREPAPDAEARFQWLQDLGLVLEGHSGRLLRTWIRQRIRGASVLCGAGAEREGARGAHSELQRAGVHHGAVAPLGLSHHRGPAGAVLLSRTHPEEVIRQYQAVIGTPYLPAYWAFGYQLCRYNYHSLQELKDAVQRTRDAQIPYDVQYADIDYMDRYKDFTYDKDRWAGFPEFVEQLHSWGMKLILIFDPPVQADYDVFKRGIDSDASFVEWPSEGMVQRQVNDQYPLTKNRKTMLAVQWPHRHAAFPDWLDPEGRTAKWWSDEFVRFHKEIPFDGIWIDMNEPSVFGTNDPNFNASEFAPGKQQIEPLMCPQNKWDFPPYQTVNVYQWEAQKKQQISLCLVTLCNIGQTGRGKYRMYDTHSLYGWAETVATQKAIRASTGKRGAVISRSTFVSSGHYGGHWLGDNRSRWPDLRGSIIGAQEFNMFGIPQVGADVCGFGGNTNEELCVRWHQLGAFHSYYRNHNDMGNIPQEPAQWPSVATATRVANLFRYRHLPYLYSLHFRASMEGGTVVRPLFFEFPDDANTHQLSFQFMWGPALVVVPVISPNVDSVRDYLPQNASWYSVSEAHRWGEAVPAGYSTFRAPRDTPLPTFLRGGHIIPKQEPALTIAEMRKKPFQLSVALKHLCPCTSEAEGEMFWDDGESIVDDFGQHPYFHFRFEARLTLTETVIKVGRKHSSSKDPLPTLDQIVLFGHRFAPKLETAKLNGAKLELDSAKSHYDAAKKVLTVEKRAMVPLGATDGGEWTLSWEVEHPPEPANGVGSQHHSRLHTVSFGLVAIAAFLFCL